MSIHCAFLFPKHEFNLVFMNTIGYISDNMFYRFNMTEDQTTEIQLNPRGRSYQAFTANHKRGLIVLADYGKNPNIYFDYMHRKENSFEIRDVCTLEIQRVCLSLDCRYLLVCCGIPEKHILLVDIENRRVLKGEQSTVKFIDRKINRIEFNPSNNRIFAVMYEKEIEIYHIAETFSHSHDPGNTKLQENIRISLKTQIKATEDSSFETFCWDQINNLYVSNGRNVFVYSTDTEKEVISYDLEGDFEGQVISNFILSPKHLILVYCNGRIEWINKYYPDLMEEEEIKKKPFYMDGYYEFEKKINYALYNHDLSKIIVAHKNGTFSVMTKQAQTTENQDEEEEKKDYIRDGPDNKKFDIGILHLGPFHANQIVFCREIPGKAILMTISKAGRMVLWSTKQKHRLLYLETALDVAAADVTSDFSILCTSNHKGVVQFYEIRDFNNIKLFKQFRLVEKGEINQIQFSGNSKQVACLSTENKRIFYILTDESHDFQVLGYVNLPYTPYSMCWNRTSKVLVKPRFEHLLCCIGFGIIMINGPPATSVKLRGKQFEINCEMYGLRTDLDQKLIEVLPTGEIISTGADKMIKKYKQLEDPIAKFNPESKSAIPPPLEEVEAHDLEITFMKLSSKFFVSGGADGTLHIRALDNFNAVKSIHVCGWKNGNLSTGAVSEIDGLYFACGKDGALSMWKTKELQINFDDKEPSQKSRHESIKTQGNNLKYFEIAIEDQYSQKMKETIAKKKKDQLQKITKIRSELKQLLAENESHDELEKLTRDEFVIDLEHRDRMTKIGLQNCERIKKQSTRNVLYNEVYRNKLKQITWDIMQEHLKAINGIKNNYIVYNYQIRKLTYEEKRKVQLIMDLRKNQQKELKKRGATQGIDPEFYKNKNIINGGILQPLILTVLEKKDDKKEQKGKKKKEKEEEAQEKKPEQIEELPKQEIWQYLYSSFELFSDNAKKNQIILMKNVIIKIKQAFNREFNKLLKLRQSQNEIINDKNKAIIQICDELKRSHEVIVSKKNILENPERILEVGPKDIPFARYLSREEREKLEKERLKEEERLRALAEDDASQRALQKMMGGTLEEKKTSVLEVTVEREKWMDKPVEEMTDDEKNKMKEYEQKKQKAEQQKERIVKKLQAELRKLKLEIDDIMEKYDEKLFALLRRRIEYDLRIEQQELYCIKLSLSMSNFKAESEYYEELKKKEKYYEQRLEELENQKRQMSELKEEIEREKESKKGLLDMKRLGDSQGRIKVLETNTFDEYHNNIKKKRQLEENLLKNDPISQYQIVKLDPMKQLESKILASQNEKQIKYFIPDKKAFIEANQISESIYNILESRFNARKEEAEYERKLKGIVSSLAAIEVSINKQKSKEETDEKELKNIENYLKQSKSDLEVLFRIKKGFVQIDNEKPVPLLDDALLIGKNEIDDKNQQIEEKAKLKIDVMKEIKTSKIQVTESTLNLERQQALINELSTMIKQVQMLKVKKEMQTALAKKDTKINENELRSLKEQIQKVRKEGEKRISLFEKKIEKVNQEVESIKKENKQLEVQKWNLENTVKQREKIKDMMVGENGKGNEEAAEKFEQISINRKLFDKAKQQTDEIELLREELSKLKAKTFANFSSVQR